MCLPNKTCARAHPTWPVPVKPLGVTRVLQKHQNGGNQNRRTSLVQIYNNNKAKRLGARSKRGIRPRTFASSNSNNTRIYFGKRKLSVALNVLELFQEGTNPTIRGPRRCCCCKLTDVFREMEQPNLQAYRRRLQSPRFHKQVSSLLQTQYTNSDPNATPM